MVTSIYVTPEYVSGLKNIRLGINLNYTNQLYFDGMLRSQINTTT